MVVAPRGRAKMLHPSLCDAVGAKAVRNGSVDIGTIEAN